MPPYYLEKVIIIRIIQREKKSCRNFDHLEIPISPSSQTALLTWHINLDVCSEPIFLIYFQFFSSPFSHLCTSYKEEIVFCPSIFTVFSIVTHHLDYYPIKKGGIGIWLWWKFSLPPWPAFLLHYSALHFYFISLPFQDKKRRKRKKNAGFLHFYFSPIKSKSGREEDKDKE